MTRSSRKSTAGTSSADAGAREISRLLTTPDPSFERATHRLATALPHGIEPHGTRPPRLAVDHGVVDAIGQIRRAYRRLHGRIGEIETKRRAAKARVLRALEELDSSFAILLRSLDARGHVTGARVAHQAHAHQEHAAAELGRALKELA